MVESALINTLLGCLAGTLAGIMPGTGLLVALVCAYPYLITLDLIGILCFYIGLANLAQFTGSVTAIYFGVPGETNSVPSVVEGHALSKKGNCRYKFVECCGWDINTFVISKFLSTVR